METTNADAKTAREGDEAIVREMIQHENGVLANRIIWMTTLQGFTFTAIGFAWKDARALTPCLCALGVGVAVLTVVNSVAATRAQFRLSDWWDRHKPHDYRGPGVIGLRVDQRTRARFGLLQYVTPQDYIAIFIAVVWIVIYLTHLRRGT